MESGVGNFGGGAGRVLGVGMMGVRTEGMGTLSSAMTLLQEFFLIFSQAAGWTRLAVRPPQVGHGRKADFRRQR